MALDTLLRKSKSLIAVPLLSLALASSPLCYKNNDACPKKSITVGDVSPAQTLEDYTKHYDIGIYILGIKFVSADADFYYKKTEENGTINEFMSASGRFSDKYYGNFSTFFSKDGEPFEKQSYTINFDKKNLVDQSDFYKDKIVFVEDCLEKVVSNDGYVGLQSVIKPLFTEDLYEGQTVYSKVFLEGKYYDCKFVVKEKEKIKVKGKSVRAYHVTLKATGVTFNKEKAADIWVVKGTPHNKLVKIVLTPFIFTELIAVSDP